jgi:coatomer subunit beta
LTHFASEPREYLKHIMKSTNMSCLTPEGAMAGDSDFLSANLYARSLFGMSCPSRLKSARLWFVQGENALANLSIERLESGSITGHVRIRSKTQGIALSLGDRITIGTNVFFLLSPH